MPVSGPHALRERILDAARQRFIQQGYQGLSMRQIAQAVGVSKPAIYYHFQDKEQLFLAVIDAYLDEMEDLLDRIRDEDGTARHQITSIVRDILSLPVEKRAAIHLASQDMAQLSRESQAAIHQAYREKFSGKIQDILRAGIQKGELRPVDPEVAAWTLLGMMVPYFSPAHLEDIPLPVHIVEQILAIYLDGIALSQDQV